MTKQDISIVDYKKQLAKRSTSMSRSIHLLCGYLSTNDVLRSSTNRKGQAHLKDSHEGCRLSLGVSSQTESQSRGVLDRRRDIKRSSRCLCRSFTHFAFISIDTYILSLIYPILSSIRFPSIVRKLLHGIGWQAWICTGYCNVACNVSGIMVPCPRGSGNSQT